MSSNRLRYDQCAYKTEMNQSVSPLEYVLNPMKYENCQKCRHEFGLVGGTNVSHIKGNLVDLENDLRGATRPATHCPSRKYKPTNKKSINIPSTQCNKEKNIDLTPVHLPPCQMLRYPSIPLPSAPNYNTCENMPKLNCPKPCNI